MRNTLFIMAGLLVIIWLILMNTIDTAPSVHLLLIGAAFLIIFRIVFGRGMSKD